MIFVIFFGICGYFMYSGYSETKEEYFYKKNYSEVVGEVRTVAHVIDHTKGGLEDWVAIGDYEIEGARYEFRVSGYSAEKGDKYTFYYDPKTKKQFYSKFNDKFFLHPYAKLLYGTLLLILMLLIAFDKIISYIKWQSNYYEKKGIPLLKQVISNIKVEISSKTSLITGIGLMMFSGFIFYAAKYWIEEKRLYTVEGNYYINLHPNLEFLISISLFLFSLWKIINSINIKDS